MAKAALELLVHLGKAELSFWDKEHPVIPETTVPRAQHLGHALGAGGFAVEPQQRFVT